MASSFEAFYRLLADEFPEEWTLQRRIIDSIPGEKQRVPLANLCGLARRHVNVSNREALPEATCERLVAHAIALIRLAAAVLFVRGQNNAAYALTHPEPGVTHDIGWEQEKDHMERIRQSGVLERVVGSRRTEVPS